MKKFLAALLVITIIVYIGFELFKTFNIESTISELFSSYTTSQSAETNNDALEAVTVSYVVDGDTLVVKNDQDKEFKVRMIGVDTPESVNPDESKNTTQGKEASDYTKSQIKEGQTVFLQYDKEKTDKYDRTLAYVWTKYVNDVEDENNVKDYMYNAQLLSEGYAKVMTIKPNNKYQSLFERLEMSAKMGNRGLWEEQEFWSMVIPFFSLLKMNCAHGV